MEALLYLKAHNPHKSMIGTNSSGLLPIHEEPETDNVLPVDYEANSVDQIV